MAKIISPKMHVEFYPGVWPTVVFLLWGALPFVVLGIVLPAASWTMQETKLSFLAMAIIALSWLLVGLPVVFLTAPMKFFSTLLKQCAALSVVAGLFGGPWAVSFLARPTESAVGEVTTFVFSGAIRGGGSWIRVTAGPATGTTFSLLPKEFVAVRQRVGSSPITGKVYKGRRYNLWFAELDALKKGG
jgi:hypothetical protein